MNLYIIIFKYLKCGWANASDAVEIMCISYTTTAMMKEFEVSDAQISSLGMALFLGWFVIIYSFIRNSVFKLYPKITLFLFKNIDFFLN